MNENTIVSLRFRKIEDADIIEFLKNHKKNHGNIAGLIKASIREFMITRAQEASK